MIAKVPLSKFIKTWRRLWPRLLILALIFCCLVSSPEFTFGQPRIYSLEKVFVDGTERISAQQVREELDLYTGMRLNDELVVVLRERLLGLGLFRSVLLYMRKGSKPGQAHLHIDLEDDPSVLGPWAIGTELALTTGEPKQKDISQSSPSFGYRAQILARNILTAGYRGSAGLDIDSRGVLREWNAAMGLPRFSQESAQFDGQVSVVDVGHRYHKVLGFGQKADVYWSQDDEAAAMVYGVSMYLNRERFAIPGAPKSLIGPRWGYQKETRLLGFVPSDGYGYRMAFLLPVGKTDQSVLEVGGAQTFTISQSLITTFGAKALAVGAKGSSVRFDLKLDIPVGRSDKTSEFAKVFVLLQAGQDQYDGIHLDGSAGIFGLRYHSSGFIAELALKVTKVPNHLEPYLEPSRRGGEL